MNARLFLASALLLGTAAQAATLDFGAGPAAPTLCSASPDGGGAVGGCGDYAYIHQSTGDVAGVLDVHYSAPRLAPDRSLQWWSTGYNNLYGVAWAGGSDGDSQARIDLRVLDGSVLSLQSLDLGGYPATQRSTTLTIVDLGSNATLFSTTQSVGSLANTATTFSFSSLSSTTGLRIEWQDSAYNVGIDNIQYTLAPVPEPGTWALFVAGLLATAGLVRRRRG